MLFKIGAIDSGNLIAIPSDGNDYNEYNTLVGYMRDLPTSRWTNKDGVRGWEFQCSQATLEYIEAHFREGIDYEVSPTAKTMLNSEKIIMTVQRQRANKRWQYLFEGKRSEFVIPSTEEKISAMDHQVVAVESMLHMPHFALLMEMGTGKTYCICAELDYYIRNLKDDELFKGLIVCPKSLRENWRRELTRFICDAWDVKIEVLDSSLGGAEGLVNLMQSDCRAKIGIISYDAVRSILPFLKAFNPDYMALDESHYVKSASTKRWKNLIDIADQMAQLGGKKRILTGTFIGNSVADLWAQFEILKRGCLGANSIKGFLRQYAECESVGDWTAITGYKSIDRLKELMARNSFMVTKDQCLDLPDKLYDTRYIEMSPEMAEVYNTYLRDMSVEIQGKALDTEFIIAQLIKLRQMTSGFVNMPIVEDSKFSIDGVELDNWDIKETVGTKTVEIEGGRRKLEAMLEEAESVVKSSKLIIWCTFHHDIDNIMFELQMRGIRAVKFDGRVKDKDRQIAIDEFNNNDAIRVFVGQQRAGGIGLTLLGNTTDRTHTCRTVYFYNNSYSYLDRSQAEDRNHRIGQNNKVLYVDWCYEHTIDVSIAMCLQAKKDLSDLMKDVSTIKQVLLGETNE